MTAPDPLASLWARADAEESRFSADDVATWPAGQEQLLVGLGLLRRDDNTTTVICDACPDGHVEEVVFVRSPAGSPVRAYIWCPHAGRVAVAPERLMQWVVDSAGTASAVATGLDVAGQPEEVVPGRIWHLGKATIAGRSRDMFLARGLTWIDAPSVLAACERLNGAASPVVFVPSAVPPADVWQGDAREVVPLGTVIRLHDGRLAADHDHLESLLSRGKRSAPIKAQQSFPTQVGIVWRDVTVTMLDNGLLVQAKRTKREFSFASAGFEEKRKRGVPDIIWGLLKVFAMRGGTVPVTDDAMDHRTRTNLKQYVTVLRKRLRALIPGIEGDPISFDKDERCYRAAFTIKGSETPRFPTPAGVEWPMVSITLVDSATIRIMVPATQRQPTWEYSDDGRVEAGRWETAEQASELARELSLVMLGLTDDIGQPDRRGAALIDVLRGQGVVKRLADDDAMLELCGFLTALMGIDGSPFDFAPNDEKWVARFDASCEPASAR